MSSVWEWLKKYWMWVLFPVGILIWLASQRKPGVPLPTPIQNDEEKKAEEETKRIEDEARALTERIQEQSVEERRQQVERLRREAEAAGNADRVNEILQDVSREMRE